MKKLQLLRLEKWTRRKR